MAVIALAASAAPQQPKVQPPTANGLPPLPEYVTAALQPSNSHPTMPPLAIVLVPPTSPPSADSERGNPTPPPPTPPVSVKEGPLPTGSASVTPERRTSTPPSPKKESLTNTPPQSSPLTLQSEISTARTPTPPSPKKGSNTNTPPQSSPLIVPATSPLALQSEISIVTMMTRSPSSSFSDFTSPFSFKKQTAAVTSPPPQPNMDRNSSSESAELAPLIARIAALESRAHPHHKPKTKLQRIAQCFNRCSLITGTIVGMGLCMGDPAITTGGTVATAIAYSGESAARSLDHCIRRGHCSCCC
jgi:hypothetical protein